MPTKVSKRLTNQIEAAFAAHLKAKDWSSLGQFVWNGQVTKQRSVYNRLFGTLTKKQQRLCERM